MAEERIFRAALVIIGDEILSGRTQDANLAYLAKWLNVQGIRLAEARVVADRIEAIAEAVNACRAAYDYVFTTGGIGPTHDDITVDGVAAAFDVPVVMHPDAEALLRDYSKERITPARLRMARVPEGATLIDNPASTAPGVKKDNVFSMAGIPAIMRSMLQGLEGTLEGGAPVLSRTVGAYVPESTVADLLAQVEADHPGVQVGSYPFWRENRVGANFVVRGVDPATVDAALGAIRNGLLARGHSCEDGEI